MEKLSNKKVVTSDLIKALKLDIIYRPEGIETYIETPDINRPGLQLAGFLKNFQYERVQIIGQTEYLYFKSLTNEQRVESIDKLMQFDIPLLVISTKQKVLPEILESAKKYSKIIVSSKETSTKTVSKISYYLNENLAPELLMHGVLVDIDGIGILITGESGIGKSETALELIKKNHRLVADDAVRIIKLDEDTLIGKSTEVVEHYMEIRGLGIVNIRSLYGIGAVKNSKKIDMVVNLETWDEGKYYDRLGLDENFTSILDTKVEQLVIPVRPGRNISTILELAARNKRLKSSGYNAAVEFNQRLLKSLEKNRKGE
ncbi:HPr(Ser) kinase/phosphatase [[Eubacterium] yurii subsp. margaretiae ATCC 43715]|nr:HPr(Ser) kinase/phosphatase [[Eubacterium] yurii subsp. margaretiae ATCC 43715]